jgi:hypothetical protein
MPAQLRSIHPHAVLGAARNSTATGLNACEAVCWSGCGGISAGLDELYLCSLACSGGVALGTVHGVQNPYGSISLGPRLWLCPKGFSIATLRDPSRPAYCQGLVDSMVYGSDL